MLTQDDYDFLSGPFQRLEGWCNVEAAAMTLHLQRFQSARSWSAPNYEIGVFKGKYLSVLTRAATVAGTRTTGIDIFTSVPLTSVAALMERELGVQESLLLIEKDSSQYSPEELSAVVGAPASWISIDGDHTAEGVFRDLVNAEATLAPWGIIAVDDFINPYAIGVVEGAIRYLSGTQTKLKPFCFCANKLLVSFGEYTDLYFDQVPPFCAKNTQFPMFQHFTERHLHLDESWSAQRLLGRKVWLIA